MANRQTETETPAPTVALTFDQLKELLAANKPSQDDQIALLEKQAELNAKAHQKLSRPENPQHPGKGAYAYPEGEVARPKPALRCKMTWGGTDEIHDVLTPQECELLNAIEPGVYHLERTDGSKMKVEVAATRNDVTNSYERIDVRFQTRGQLRHNLPSKVNMLLQIIAQQASSSAALPVG
jgi:hypothetical protein